MAMLSLTRVLKWRGYEAIFPIGPESGKTHPVSDLVTHIDNAIALKKPGQRAWDGNSEQQLWCPRCTEALSRWPTEAGEVALGAAQLQGARGGPTAPQR